MSDHPIAAALAYHEQIKHRLPNCYANSLGFLERDPQVDEVAYHHLK